MAVTLAYRAESLRARARAFEALHEGDKVSVGRCGGGIATFTFTGWDGYWMVGKSGVRDYSPSAIVSVNGQKASFLDPLWERGRFDPRTGRRYGDHGTAAEALEWILGPGDDNDPANTVEFLRAWDEGRAWEEWPEFYCWLDPTPA